MRFQATTPSLGQGFFRLLLMLIFAGVAACAAPTSLPPPQKPMVRPEPEVHRRHPLPTIDFTIQVGAFSTSERAARYAVRLQKKGLDAYFFVDADGLFKVRFDRFESKAAARGHAQALQAGGHIDQFYIVQPSAAGDPINAREALRNHIVQTARRFIGIPYRWGGTSSQSGFDCSGLTMTVYRLNGLSLPRSSHHQYRAGTHISRKILQKGDLVFFATQARGRVSHVGIYMGRGKFMHAPGKGKRIRIASLSTPYFQSRYIGARSYF